MHKLFFLAIFCLFSIFSISQTSKNQITAKFHLDKSQTIEMSVFSLNGQLIKRLFNKNLNSGNHSLIFDTSNFKTASGVKVLVFNSKELKTVKKIRIY